MRAVLLASLLSTSLFCGGVAAQEPPPPDEWLAVPAGGLRFELNERVTLESQRLFFSPSSVRVTYRLMNSAETDSLLFVGFPFPSLPEPDPPAPSLAEAFDDARLTLDGEEQELHSVVTRLYNDGRDVTSILEAAGIDLATLGDGALNQLSRSAYREIERALTDRGEQRPNRYAWSWEIEPRWRITLPSRTTAVLELSYTPYTGLSVDRFTSLSELKDLAHVEAYCAAEQPDLLDWMTETLRRRSTATRFVELPRRELSYRWESLPEGQDERTLRIEVSDPARGEDEARIAFCFPGGIARLPDGTHLAGGFGKPDGERLDIVFFE
ncbi:MAG: DUF4424 family protein [Kiloniellales bacterium]